MCWSVVQSKERAGCPTCLSMTASEIIMCRVAQTQVRVYRLQGSLRRIDKIQLMYVVCISVHHCVHMCMQSR
jgi:hypothetical protein